MLRRHDNYEAEANITSAIRDFLIVSGLAKVMKSNEEVSPATGSVKAVDLTALTRSSRSSAASVPPPM